MQDIGEFSEHFVGHATANLDSLLDSKREYDSFANAFLQGFRSLQRKGLTFNDIAQGLGNCIRIQDSSLHEELCSFFEKLIRSIGAFDFHHYVLTQASDDTRNFAASVVQNVMQNLHILTLQPDEHDTEALRQYFRQLNAFTALFNNGMHALQQKHPRVHIGNILLELVNSIKLQHEFEVREFLCNFLQRFMENNNYNIHFRFTRAVRSQEDEIMAFSKRYVQLAAATIFNNHAPQIAHFRDNFFGGIHYLQQIFPHLRFRTILLGLADRIQNSEARLHQPLSTFFQNLVVQHPGVGTFNFYQQITRQRMG